jgi:hypothetical protein
LLRKLSLSELHSDKSDDKSKNKNNRNHNRNNKGKDNHMAIVHVAFKSSSKAPPAAAHAQYIARDGQYEQRGGVELVESGNMPEFAQADPFAFWIAADAHERVNGRTYTELQIALPRELGKTEREELAREATRELLGERFAYTLAIHRPLAKDNIDQPHMHLMFSERTVDATTRGLTEDRFFKRNGAKKDPEWNRRDKPDEVREKWVELMNGAMERAGIEQQLDARSYRERGREDLEELKEPKLLGGEGIEAKELRAQVDELRSKRAELPASHLDRAEAAEQIERKTQRAIVEVERKRDEELNLLDELIAELKQAALALKDKAVEIVQSVATSVASIFGAEKSEIALDRGAAVQAPDPAAGGQNDAAIVARFVAEADEYEKNMEAERQAAVLSEFLAGADEYERQEDRKLAAGKEVEGRRLAQRPKEASREELDVELREIARAKARFPNGRIEPLKGIKQSEVTGRILGYTTGNEEALLQRLGGGLVRIDTKGERLYPLRRELDFNPRTGEIEKGKGIGD